MVGFLRFGEPATAPRGRPRRFRRQLALTLRTLTARREVLRVVLLSALIAMAAQVVFEFGPLWLCRCRAVGPFGPYWAALVSTLGMGGIWPRSWT